jgi:hypothetical protein
MDTERVLDLTRLRLAAAVAHQVPSVALTIWSTDGPTVVIARLERHHPDLSACAFRSMVRSAMQGQPPVGLGWAFDVADLTIDGIGVRHVGDGVVAVERSDGQGRWWPTLLPVDMLTRVVADSAAAVLEEGLVDHQLVAASEVAAHVDTELGVTVVQLRTPTGPVPHDRRCDLLARSVARACVVAELIDGVDSSPSTRHPN